MFYKRIFSNTSAQVASRVISSGSGFLITLLVARHFGIIGYSDLAKITAFVGLFYLGVDLGANAIFLQFEKQQQSFKDLLSFRFFLASCIFLLICLVVIFLPYNSTTTSGYSVFVKLGIILFSFSFFSRAIVYSCAAVFQQSFSYAHATKATLASSFTTLCFVIAAVVWQLPLLWVVIGYFVGGFFEAGISLLFVKQNITLTLPSLTFFKKMFWLTLPLTMLLFLNLLYFRIDMILLTFFQKASAVGFYDFAYKFFDFLIALPLFLSNSLYPILLNQEKNSRIQAKNIGLYTMLFFVVGLILVPIVWFAAPLLVIVKQDFSPSIIPLRLLSLSLPIFFATNILQWIFITKKKQTFLVFVYATSLMINVILNLIFIPQYSYVASSIITGFSELLILLVMIGYMYFKHL